MAYKYFLFIFKNNNAGWMPEVGFLLLCVKLMV